VKSEVLDFPQNVWNLEMKLSWNDINKFIKELSNIATWLSRVSTGDGITLSAGSTSRLTEITAFIERVNDDYNEAAALFSLATNKPLTKLISKANPAIKWPTWNDLAPDDKFILDHSTQTAFIKTSEELQPTVFDELVKHLPTISQTANSNDYKTTVQQTGLNILIM